MLDDRTNRRAPRAGARKRWPKATCHQARGLGYYVLSNEPGQSTRIGEGRSAWAAWMEAEIAPRKGERIE